MSLYDKKRVNDSIFSQSLPIVLDWLQLRLFSLVFFVHGSQEGYVFAGVLVFVGLFISRITPNLLKSFQQNLDGGLATA